jgi:hypothetical protein
MSRHRLEAPRETPPGFHLRTESRRLPAKDLDAYERFVRQLVQNCAGRVHYWQCDNEPSDVGLTWAGTADSYLAELRAARARA